MLQAPYILIPTTTNGGNSQTSVSVPQNADGTSTVTPPASGTVRGSFQLDSNEHIVSCVL